jgi:hypothetical protein
MWKQGEALGIALIIAAMGFALWLALHPHSPGWSIGAFGLIAFIASYRMQSSMWEKLAWIFVLAAFLKLEFRAINANDAENTATKNAQNLQFQTIIDELKEQLAASQTQLATSATQYQATIGQVNQTLKTTQKAANYASESVRALTGGDSYLEVDFTWPFWVNKPPPGEIGFTVKSAGKYPLWDVNVDWQEGDPLEAYKKGIVRNSLSIGTVSNTYAKPLGPLVSPDPAKDNVYWFWVFSRNQPSVVTIHIRYNREVRHWESSVSNFRGTNDPKHPRKVLYERPMGEIAPILPIPPD